MLLTYTSSVIKWKTRYHSVETMPKSNIKVVERGKIDTPGTKIFDRTLSLLGTGTSIKSGGVKLVL